MMRNLLLKDTANVGIRGVSGKGKRSCRMRMGKKGGMRESLLKSLSHGRSPGKEFGSANQSICEWSENGGSMRNKTAV